MKPVSILITFGFILASCFNQRLYQKEDVINFQYDSSGLITAKTYRKMISWPSGDKLATITEELDSNCRVKVMYGYDHPALGKKFMVRYNYGGSFERIISKFKWPHELPDSSFSDYKKYFSSQVIYSPGEPAKTIHISIQNPGADTLKGYFSLANARTGLEERSFRFTLSKADIEFNKEGFLNLENITSRY